MADRPADSKPQPTAPGRIVDGHAAIALVVFCVCALLLGMRSYTKWRGREYEFVPEHAGHGAASLQISEGDNASTFTVYYVPMKSTFYVIRENSRMVVRPEDIVITDHRGNHAHADRLPARMMERPRIEYTMKGASLNTPPEFGDSPAEYHLKLRVSYDRDGPHVAESEELYPRPGERHRFGDANIGEGLFLGSVYGLLFISGVTALLLFCFRLLQRLDDRERAGAGGSADTPSEHSDLE